MVREMLLDRQKNILESWIMVEHLSEGDISLKDKNLMSLNDLKEDDFYHFLQDAMRAKGVDRKKKGGIVFYMGIFPFEEVVNFLREEFGIGRSESDVQYGTKFSLALHFDRDLNYDDESMFLTESAYIRHHHKIPDEKTFQDREREIRDELKQSMTDTAKDPDRFNSAVRQILNRYGIEWKDCRCLPVSDIGSDAANMHSFFVGDLEKAKEMKNRNLRLYLEGGDPSVRVNLDTKSDSPNFNPDAVKAILAPECYPLARFPGNPEFALSLMQQIAVNLSAGYDEGQIRSVNGPPGTGKTTLLKDVFADLIVKQAWSISRLKDPVIRGTEDTAYYEKAAIGEIPEDITVNSIVVASSNNGAVQNIVNELPLTKEVDEQFRDELKKLDYFADIANSDVKEEWEKQKDGSMKRLSPKAEPLPERKFWGLFSLEGGRAQNMTGILSCLQLVHDYLEEEYDPDPDIYEEFLEKYSEMERLRSRAAEGAGLAGKESEKLAYARELLRGLDKEKAEREAAAEQRRADLSEALDRNQAACRQLQEETDRRRKEEQEFQEKLQEYRQLYQDQKQERDALPADSEMRMKYDQQVLKLRTRYLKLLDQDGENREEEKQLQQRSEKLEEERTALIGEQEKLSQELVSWEKEQKKEIRQKAGLSDYSAYFPGKVLDMGQDYESLQLSNPWFDEPYRVRQSELFILALRVRKQFLYDNRKNLKAAVNIWNRQNSYLEKKRIIKAAWNWISMAVPVISSTFASFAAMTKNLDECVLGHVFVDEAGQALPQAAVGAVWRTRHLMVVGDPSQIKPVLTLEPAVLAMLGKHYGVGEKYLSETASVQTLVDSVSRYGFYTEKDMEDSSWIGIPLWVHRRCRYPMFTISNAISYHNLMVQGKKADGKTGWYDVGGSADGKFVREQGLFLKSLLEKMIQEDPSINDKSQKDKVYIITPFRNVAFQLARMLDAIHFTRREKGKPTNIGTIHTFQGKEAPIVFMVLGADERSRGAASWAVSEPNMMNVAATRAKEEFYIIGDKRLYMGVGSEVIRKTNRIIKAYQQEHPDLVPDIQKTEGQPEDHLEETKQKTEGNAAAESAERKRGAWDPAASEGSAEKSGAPASARAAAADAAEKSAGAVKICPRCGRPMKIRVAKKGANAGRKFWGCTGFVKGCRYTEPYKENG